MVRVRLQFAWLLFLLHDSRIEGQRRDSIVSVVELVYLALEANQALVIEIVIFVNEICVQLRAYDHVLCLAPAQFTIQNSVVDLGEGHLPDTLALNQQRATLVLC